MVVVRCNAGLGNRLMRMVGGLAVANHFNRDTKICWPLEYDCECKYTALFNKALNVIEVEDTYNNCDLYIVQHKHLDHYQDNKAIPYDLLHSSFDVASYNNIGYMSSVIPDFITKDVITNCVTRLNIKRTIIRSALDFIKLHNIDKSVHGLVVRLSDRHNTKTVTAAYDTLKQNPGKRFFVTCDCEEFLNSLSIFSNVTTYKQTAFPINFKNRHELNSVFKHYMPHFKINAHRRVCYRNEESIVEAFITMLILSQTTIYPSITPFESYFQKAASILFSHIDLKRFLLNI